MNVELFIAKRIRVRTGKGKESPDKTPPAIRIATWGVALGMTIMIVAVAVVVGFKKEVSRKIIDFGAHIQITGTPYQNSYETAPVAIMPALDSLLSTMPEVASHAVFATKPGILKTDDDFSGVVLKGITADYPVEILSQYIVEGAFPDLSTENATDEILISRYIADRLRLHAGDALHCYFVEENVRARKFTIAGIYQTNLTEYDRFFIFGDARHVQRLNGWHDDQYSGVEIRLHDADATDAVNDRLYAVLLGVSDRYGNPCFTQTIRELNPQLFNWLDLLDMNVWVILALMSLVSGFTMISGLLIIILEHTRMIGTLKALGAGNRSIRRIFLYVALFLVGKGILWGDVLGIGVCLLQKYLHVLKLDPEIYYIPAVPVDFNFLYLLLLNVGGFIISSLMLIAPSYIISAIRPAKTLKFE